MSRFNVIIVIFDLHSTTPMERKDYRQFRKYLISSGYSFVQESVYAKLLRNNSTCSSELSALRGYSPEEGNVMTITMSLNEFKDIKFIKGKPFDFSSFSDPILSF